MNGNTRIDITVVLENKQNACLDTFVRNFLVLACLPNLAVPSVFDNMEARTRSLLLDDMACSHESDDVGSSHVPVRYNVPNATSSRGGPESVTDSLSGVMPTVPIASTSVMEDGENNSANNGGTRVGSDTRTLSSQDLTRFNKIAIQGIPQMAVD